MKITYALFTILSLLITTISSSQSLTSQSHHQFSQSLHPNLPHVQSINMSFRQFKQTFGKQYSSVAEQNYRRHIFYQNIKKMNAHHQNQSRLYNMKPNQFLDITSSEFKQTFTGTFPSNQHSKNVSACYIKDKRKNRENGSLNQTLSKKNRTKKYNSSRQKKEGQSLLSGSQRQLEEVQTQSLIHTTNNEQQIQSNSSVVRFVPPTNFQIDWTIYSGSVKYQGLCGACYAFSSVDMLSAANAIHKYGFFVPLSVQQIVDCPNNNLTFGCSGGYLEGALSYIQLFGVSTQQQYPYISTTSGRQGKCKQVGGSFKLSSFNSIRSGDCQSILDSLTRGPVAAGIAGYTLQFYDTGIFNDCNQVLDHAVVIIGYRSGLGWRIKNSWGLRWGQLGYGWIGEGNTCGICNMAVSVTL